MKLIISLLFLFSVLLLSCQMPDDSPRALQDGEVMYKFTFNATWSKQTHPTDFPDNPHFSPLIGAVHNDQVEFWNTGAYASTGIKIMAETGGTGEFCNEISASISDKKSFEVIRGSSLSLSPGSVELTFIANKDYHFFTLVSMLAPSPDWFTGVHGHSLMEGGEWIDGKSFDVHIYDAGTDSGVSFTSPDSVTNPPELITRLSTGAFSGDGKTVVGQFRLDIVERK